MQWLIDKNYVEGYEDGSLRLDRNITRAEFTKMIVVVQGEKVLADALKDEPSKFSDVATDHWANGYINFAAKKEYIKGYEDGTFKPEDNITNEEVIAILARLHPDFREVTSAGKDWSKQYVDFAEDHDILKGIDVKDILKENAIRETVFEMIYNYAQEIIARTKRIVDEAQKDLEKDNNKGSGSIGWGYPGTSWIEKNYYHRVRFFVDGKLLVRTNIKNGYYLLTPENPVKEGYKFLGWYSGTTKYDTTSRVYRDLDLVAKFKKIEDTTEPEKPTPVEKVNITFDGNGGTGTMAAVEVNKGNSYKLPANEFTAPEGQEFKAWEVNGSEFPVGKEVTVNTDLTVKALWKDLTTAPEQPTEEQVKADFEKAVAESVDTLAPEGKIGDIGVAYNDKEATITLPADMTDFTAFGHGILTQLKNLVNNDGLKSYKIGDNEVNLADMDNIYEAVEPIIRDFAAVAGVDMSDLTDFTNANNDAISAKVAEILQTLAENETPVIATLTIEQDGTTTEDNYTVKFVQESDSTDPEPTPPTEAEVKENFEKAVAASVENIDTGDVEVVYNDKEATITLPADMTDFTAFGHGILTQLKNLVNNDGLKSYKIGDNEVNLADMDNIYEAVEPIIRDFAAVAGVDMSDLTDFTNANNDAISAKVAEILQALAENETPVIATLTIEQDGTTTEDNYTVNFRQNKVFTITLKDYRFLSENLASDMELKVEEGKTLKDAKVWNDTDEMYNPFTYDPKRTGYTVKNLTDQDGSIIDPNTTTINEDKTITVNWTPSEETIQNQLKEELNTVVDNSVSEVAQNIGNADLMFNKEVNTATLLLPEGLSTVTIENTGAMTALANMIENNALQSYKIKGEGFEEKNFVNEDGSPRAISDVVSNIINDLRTAADVAEDADIPALLDALRGKTVTTTVTMKKTVDGREITATDEYTLTVPVAMDSNKVAEIENKYDVNMGAEDKKNTTINVINNNKNTLNNGLPMFNVAYDADSKLYTVKINELALDYKITQTGSYGFATTVVNFATGSHYKRSKSSLGDLKQVVITTEDGSKSVKLNEDQLNAMLKGYTFSILPLVNMFEDVFAPEGKTAQTLTLGDLTGQTYTFDYTYVDEETNEVYNVTRTMTFDTFTE